MFKSRTRSVVIPQAEHSRLSGIIANSWGNSEFDVPDFPFASFVMGVSLHDRGYGRLDNYPLGELSEQTWLDIHERSAAESFEDVCAELVVQLQLKRLVAYNLTPEREKYVKQRESFIRKMASDNELSLEAFLWADHITHFCDNVSFDFCFEESTSSTVPVLKKNGDAQSAQLKYSIGSNGEITIDPWPLNCNQLDSFIVGYKASEYPKRLEPVYIPIHISPDPQTL